MRLFRIAATAAVITAACAIVAAPAQAGLTVTNNVKVTPPASGVIAVSHSVAAGDVNGDG